MFGQSVKNIFVAGHRGMAALYPENTMVSFIAAHKAGVDMIEMDLHLSKDGELVVFHDYTVERTTDGAGAVSSFTISELKKLDAGAKFDNKFAGERVITFDEFLEFVKTTDLTLNVEVKNYSHECIDKAVKALNDAGLRGRYVLASWNAKAALYAHTAHNVPFQGFPFRIMSDGSESIYKHLYSVGVPCDRLGEPDFKKEIFEKLGTDYWTWCPDTEDNVIKCVKAGTTLMTCNDPLPALKYLKENKLHK